jgi:predicted 3-demethylubiquinone-9 3-methyltransferase (glyoxalase superfamily)
MALQRIVPNLWFDKEAREAADFYVSAFGKDSKVHSITTISGTPSGDTDIVSFRLLGYEFMAISAGPTFSINPSISFIINFDPTRDDNAAKSLDALWSKLSEGGTILMPLQEYPFSERYGWIQDKYGVSWQLMLSDPEGKLRPEIMPSLMFVTSTIAKAEEAVDMYLALFNDTQKGIVARYPPGMEPDMEGAVMFMNFMLQKQWFAAMDAHASQHSFAFNEAVSLMVYCDSQEEIDYFWESLSAVPEAEQCGWLKDRYGVSWQIVPRKMDEMLSKGTKEQIDRITQAFLRMKKIVIEDLEKEGGE